MPHAIRRSACAIIAFLASAAAVAAQPALGDTPVTLSADYSYAFDEYRYRFHNPSSFDTPFLVPHFYEQRYTSGNHWLTTTLRYALGNERLETQFGFTPETGARASDIDTFFNPSGDVVTSGTSGDARLRSLRFAQWSEGRIAGITVRAGYEYRRDEAEFLPADIVVTHTSPPSLARRYTTDREETVSQVQRIPVHLVWERPLTARWRAQLAAGGAPFVRAHLRTRLPDKYPGQDIEAAAFAWSLDARMEVEHSGARWGHAFLVSAERHWSYAQERQFARETVRLGFRLTWRP